MSRSTLVALAAGIVALLVRGLGLTRPAAFVFDEIYYVPDALAIWREGVEGSGAVHPVAGKALMAVAMQVAGSGPAGWRSAALVAGAATVALVVHYGARLTGSVTVGAAAGALVCFDGTAFTMGRTAMLDGLAAPFVTMAVGTVAVSASSTLRSQDTRIGERRPPFAVATMSGAALGAAFAVKWSTWLLVPTVAFCIAATAVHDLDVRSRRAVGAAGATIVTAAAVYIAAHLSWIAAWPTSSSCVENCGTFSGIGAFADVQKDAYYFHSGLEPSNPQATPPWRWFTEPTRLYETRIDGKQVQIVAVPSALLWATAVASTVIVVVRPVLRRRAGPAFWILISALWALLTPWAVLGRDGYSFYLAPVAPVAALLVALAGCVVLTDACARRAATAVTAMAVALFAFQVSQLAAL